jgi:hypothetical protein
LQPGRKTRWIHRLSSRTHNCKSIHELEHWQVYIRNVLTKITKQSAALCGHIHLHRQQIKSARAVKQLDLIFVRKSNRSRTLLGRQRPVNARIMRFNVHGKKSAVQYPVPSGASETEAIAPIMRTHFCSSLHSSSEQKGQKSVVNKDQQTCSNGRARHWQLRPWQAAPDTFMQKNKQIQEASFQDQRSPSFPIATFSTIARAPRPGSSSRTNLSWNRQRSQPYENCTAASSWDLFSGAQSWSKSIHFAFLGQHNHVFARSDRYTKRLVIICEQPLETTAALSDIPGKATRSYSVEFLPST